MLNFFFLISSLIWEPWTSFWICGKYVNNAMQICCKATKLLIGSLYHEFYCDLCHWPKCECNYISAPNVNRTLIVEPNYEKTILKFKLISSDENDPKFNISLTLGLKLQNHLQEISPVEGLSKLPRACPNFSKEISFDFVLFSLKKLFNIQ